MQHRNHIPIWLIAGSLVLALIFASRPTTLLAQNIRAIQGNEQQNDQILEIEQANIRVVKDALSSVPEPGGNVKFEVTIENLNPGNGDVTITSLVDSVYGDINDLGTCIIPQPISPNYNCTFFGSVSGNGGETHTSIIIAEGHDENGNEVSDRWTTEVNIDDIPPEIKLINSASPRRVLEPGGLVTFTAEINNLDTSVDPITVLTVTDTIYGDLNERGDCDFPQVLVPGRGYSCQFQAIVIGNGGESQTNIMTVEVTDDEGKPVTDSAEAIVRIGDSDPRMSVLKSVSPSTLLEPGGNVVFTVIVKNESLSSTDPITLTHLTDGVYGDLDGVGGCSMPKLILAGQSYGCTFPEFIMENAGYIEMSSVTAQAMDDEETPSSGSDDATIEIIDRLPEIILSHNTFPSAVAEAGAVVTFSVAITNVSIASSDPVTLTALTHNIYGDLQAQGDCSLPQRISPDARYGCSFTRLITGNVGEMKINVITVEGADDEGNTVRDQDSVTMIIEDTESTILLIKTVDANGDGIFSASETMPEPGGAVEYRIQVQNGSSIDDVILNSVNDPMLGNISASCGPGLPQLLQPGESIICQISHTIGGNAGESVVSVVAAIGEDDDGKRLSASSKAEVVFTDVLPTLNVIKRTGPITVTEEGAEVQFTIEITNTSVPSDPVTLETLVDELYRDLGDHSDRDDFNSCAVPRVLNSGDAYRCAFIATVPGQQANIRETYIVTTTGIDDENNPINEQSSAAILFNDAAPIIDVSQTAIPMNVPEPGGEVHFTVVIQNESNAFDPVTINQLKDPNYGDLNGQGNCRLPQIIQPKKNDGDSDSESHIYRCTFTRFIKGNPGDKDISFVTAIGEDDEGTPVRGEDETVVTISDIAPTIVVTKSANITVVASEGADVTFSIGISNVSASSDPITITKLFDTTYGDLDRQEGCTLPQELDPPGGEKSSYHCAFTVNITGNPGDLKTSVVIAEGHDDEGNSVADGDDETVTITDLEPFLVVTSRVDTATPFGGDGVYTESEIVPEPGGRVSHRIEVENISEEDITIYNVKHSTLRNLPSNDISATCIPSPPTQLGAGQKLICQIDSTFEGNAGSSLYNLVSATGVNKTGHGLTDFADSAVVIGNSPPAIQITTIPNPDNVPESGGNVNFTVIISNTSLANTDPAVISSMRLTNTDPVDIFSLQDNIHGDLNGRGDCSTPQRLNANGSYRCTYRAFVERNVNDPEVHVLIAAATDDEGNQAIDLAEATVTINDVLPEIKISTGFDPKSVDEPGTSVSFNITAHNDNSRSDPMVLLRLVDDIHGNLNSQGDCVLPQNIPAGDKYECKLPVTISGDAGESRTNTVTAEAQDDEINSIHENDSATITIGDLKPILAVSQSANPNAVLEPGENVTFTVIVNNNSVATDPVTVTSLVDDIHGNLNGQGDCIMPQVLEPDAHYSCDFTALIEGNAADTETNTIIARARDNEGNLVSGQDSVTVTLRNAPPTLRVTKTPDVPIIPESGGDVLFTVEVSNESAHTDPVTLIDLNDNIYGDLNGQGICTVPHTIQPGESYICTFTARLAGNAGDSETAIVTATGEDDDGHTVIAEGSATVVIGNIGSLLQVTKEVDADGDGSFSAGENILEPGGAVDYRIVIKNNSTVDEITLETVDDPPLGGDISDFCLPSLPVVMTPDSEVICNATTEIIGVAGDHLVNVVTVTGVDDEGNTLRDTADATVTIVQPRADLSLGKEILNSQIITPTRQLIVTYRLNYQNQGPDPASNVRLIDTLPTGMVIHQSPSYPFEGINLPLLTWSLGTLQPDESGEITITVRLDEATRGETFTNVASISCGCTDSDSSNDEGIVGLPIFEDVVAQNIPTAIALERLQAIVTEEGIDVQWTTTEEVNTSGFQLYRSTSNSFNDAVQATSTMIPSQGSSGGDYHFLDRNTLSGVPYIYWLLEIESSGGQNVYGPVQELITFQRSTSPEDLASDSGNIYLPVMIR